jgi:hypothetical protein
LVDPLAEATATLVFDEQRQRRLGHELRTVATRSGWI